MKNVLAIDLGASGGRGMVGSFDGERITLTEAARFPNGAVEQDGSLCWDWDALVAHVEQAVKSALGQFPIESVGVDTWGVDYGLLDEAGELIGPVYSYRDSRTNGVSGEAGGLIPLRELYSLTGNQIMDINTAFQLMAHKSGDPESYGRGTSLVMMPDLFCRQLMGNTGPWAERSIASTTQLYDPAKGDWSGEAVKALGLRRELLPPIREPGTLMGDLRPDLGKGVKVALVCGHDTQSAMVAIPAREKDFAFLSCGTWSLLGTELEGPVLTDTAFENGFTNEAGYGGKISFLKNITGLYLLQQCRLKWEAAGERYSFEELRSLAEEAEPFRSLVDTDWPGFSAPKDMCEAIREYCRRTGQPEPESVGQLVRCIYESLAMKYRQALRGMAVCTGRSFSTLYMVGGGSMDEMLAHFTADACGIRVSCGPQEASALGNVAVQLMALGAIGSLEEARGIVRRSVEPRLYAPGGNSRWETAYETYEKLIERGPENA